MFLTLDFELTEARKPVQEEVLVASVPEKKEAPAPKGTPSLFCLFAQS